MPSLAHLTLYGYPALQRMKVLVSGWLSNAHAVVVGQVNKRVFNPRALKNGRWPVLRHTGRSSRKTYRIPLDAHRADNGYAFVV